jgi:hypothetical protein
LELASSYDEGRRPTAHLAFELRCQLRERYVGVTLAEVAALLNAA